MIEMQEKESGLRLKELLTKQPILLVDGECGFCNKSVQFLLRHEKKNKVLHFATLNSPEGKMLQNYFEMDPNLDSIILIRGHEVYIKSCAALRLGRYMSGLWPLIEVFVIIPPFIRNAVYSLIAKHRQKIAGRVSNCELLSAEERKRFLD